MRIILLEMIELKAKKQFNKISYLVNRFNNKYVKKKLSKFKEIEILSSVIYKNKKQSKLHSRILSNSF